MCGDIAQDTRAHSFIVNYRESRFYQSTMRFDAINLYVTVIILRNLYHINSSLHIAIFKLCLAYQ